MDIQLYKSTNSLRVCGGIGIHVCLRNISRKGCRFKSDQTHQQEVRKVSKVRLQQCVHYVCNDANTTTVGAMKMRLVSNVDRLRKKLQSIHWCNFNYNCCYSSLTISNINSIHLWLVLHTTANIQRIVCAVLCTGVSKCSHFVSRSICK
jgi:hypothetical protein